jgi:CRISPR/Cas system CMR subunit Cmr6 (Cas7 group RAMP superfamily)
LLDLAEQWLKGALADLGIGAKTSADYGYWAI